MRRKIVINGRFLARRPTGVERYGREILRHIGNRLVPNGGEGSVVEATHRQGWQGHAWEQFILPVKLDRQSLLWSPANTGPLLIREQVLTIHDLSPLDHPEWFRASFALWYRVFLPILARRVRTVFTPSEYVREKVIRRFGIRNVIVTPNGVDRSIFCPDAAQTRFDLPAHYILFVGTLEPRKNLDLLLRAWNEIKDDFAETWLIVVGVNGNVFRHIDYQPQIERVRFLGYVDDETLAGLYAQATLFVLPSREEGFGLPALEAMASGTPVIVSDGGALPETVGEAGMIFHLACHAEPFGASGALSRHDITRLTDALKECLSNAGLRSALKEKGLARAGEFSWQTTAELVWKSLNEI